MGEWQWQNHYGFIVSDSSSVIQWQGLSSVVII